MFAHELGHVLFTDFLTFRTYHNNIAAGRWYPVRPALNSADLRREADFWAYIKADPKNLDMVQTAAHHISNVLEDGYGPLSGRLPVTALLFERKHGI